MAPGFRYHVTTIVAIFMALALGIVIGNSYVQTPIVEKTKEQVAGLQSQFKNEILTMKEQARLSERFEEGVRSNIVLNGFRVALIQTGDYPDTTRKVRDALEQAGATVVSETVIVPAYPARLEVARSTLMPKLRSAHPELGTDKSEVIRVIAGAIVKGGPETDIDMLADAGLIRKQGDYSQPVGYAILIGGASDESRAETVDKPLAAELKTLTVKVVLAEPETAAISYVLPLRGAEIVTVDNADTNRGRVAVLEGLRAAPGDYGIKPTARGGLVPVIRPQP